MRRLWRGVDGVECAYVRARFDRSMYELELVYCRTPSLRDSLWILLIPSPLSARWVRGSGPEGRKLVGGIQGV